MKVCIQSFVKDFHWFPQRKGKWKYVLLQPVVVRCDWMLTQVPLRLVRERYGVTLGEIHRYYIRINPGYAWDGCSCSPDHPQTMLASLVHDFLYQFSGVPGFPPQISRFTADELFEQIARESGCRWAWLYRLGLALGSWMFWERSPLDWLEIEQIHALPPD
jgi:hypothetical protein